MRKSKYVVLLGDGMPDFLIPERDNKTPLMMAKTPNLDFLAREGTAGSVSNTPEGYEPGSDVTNMEVLGFNVPQCYTGRAPLEAAAMGVNLADGDIAFRCNLVSLRPVADGVLMEDFSAGHIETEDAAELIGALNKELGNDKISFHPGVSYRHLMVWKGGDDKLKLTPPHDISDQNIRGHLPQSDFLKQLMGEAQMVLKNHPVNKRRKKEGKKEANSVWFWGQGAAPTIPAFKDVHGLNGAVITAVDLMRGIATCGKMEVIDVPGATGWIDTNYEGKAQACLDALKRVDFVYLHVESPDEAGHAGSLDYKVQAIEDFDAKVVGPVVEGLKAMGDFRVMALSDHPTPLAIKTHTKDKVPFAIYPKLDGGGAESFDEKILDSSPLTFERGIELSKYFIEGKR
ncbi:Predicted functional analog of homoserine kinase [hydrothermal vent metagenome]|uniref:Predicted functional analog of homoserine kinase n=1 Tax=hydrothermal vent metagenome TaxID=652676 RepID=A0A3B1BIQ3_9ZZZZ